MSEEVNLDEVMSRRFELDEQITARQLAHKAELLPLVEEMQLCESFVKAELLKMGAQNWTSSRTGHHTHFMTKDSVTVEDMDAVIHRILVESPLPPKDEDSTYFMSDDGWTRILRHIQATGLWALLNKAVNKTVAKELIEAGDQPPGIKFVAFKDLAWRRGKAGA
ncbi:MAG: hypothetical protein PHW66_09725 [Gallionella sp.]|nr:hypothetical protein [Gallionella sp.]